MADFSHFAAAVIPDETAPLMRGGTPVASYECESCRAVLARDMESLHPTMRYLYALLVFPKQYGTPPFMTIVAEQVGFSPEIARELPPEMRQAYESTQTGGPFMCAYTEEGKFNLGWDQDSFVLEKFEARALSVVRTSLKIGGSIRVLNDARRGDKFPSTDSKGCLAVLVASPLVVYGISASVRALL